MINNPRRKKSGGCRIISNVQAVFKKSNVYTNARQCVACVSYKSIKYHVKYVRFCVGMLPKLRLLFRGPTSSYVIPGRFANLKARLF